MTNGISADQARILFAETDDIRQDMIELRARARARALVLRRLLLEMVNELESEWNITPNVRALLERARQERWG